MLNTKLTGTSDDEHDLLQMLYEHESITASEDIVPAMNVVSHEHTHHVAIALRRSSRGRPLFSGQKRGREPKV